MEATLTSKGQLTLPKPLRDHFRLHQGDRIAFFVRPGERIELVPKKRSLRDLKGMIKPPVTGVSLAAMERAIAAGAAGHDRD